MMPAEAELAVVAIVRRLQRAAVARGQARHACARLHDPPRRLVSQQHRVHIGAAAHRALGVGVHVRAAHAHSLNPDLHFARSGIVDLHLHQPEFQGSNQFRCAHWILSPTHDTSSEAPNRRSTSRDSRRRHRVRSRLRSVRLPRAAGNVECDLKFSKPRNRIPTAIYPSSPEDEQFSSAISPLNWNNTPEVE